MPTPKKGYTIDGERVPGTTTIIGRWKESGGLIYWAYKQGMEAGLRGDAGARLYDTVEKAADIGTIAHGMVDAHIHKQVFDSSEYDEDLVEAAESAYRSYLTWERQSKLKIIDGEMQLLSHEYRFGGTPDGIGEIDGELCLIDWKTSNRVYSDHLIQLAAYKHLWDVNHPMSPITGGSHLCRFAKEHGDFAHHYFPDLSEAWEQFKLFRRAYDIDKVLKKRAA